MTESNTSEPCSSIAPVLGRIPSGVFILVAGGPDGRSTGLLASWIQQASFAPPQVTIAVNKSRYLNDWLAVGSAITLNQVAKGDKVLFGHFGKGFEPDANAFQGIETTEGNNGLPVLKGAMASMEGVLESKLDAGDHVIWLANITVAHAHQDPGGFDPYVHIRKNGLGY
ncbi:MAG: flavin reductase family protein [Planctomycetaceae bacterium]